MRFCEPERLTIFAEFYRRPHTVSQWSAEVRAFYQLLCTDVPELGETWQMRALRETEQVLKNGKNIELFMRRYGWDKRATDGYLPRPTGHTIAPQTTGYLPFDIEFETVHRDFDSRAKLITSSSVLEDKLSGRIHLSLPLAFLLDPELAELRARALRVMIDFWRPTVVLIDPFWLRLKMNTMMDQSPNPERMTHVGWQLYLNNSKVIDALGEDFEYERLGQGVLIQTQREMPQVNDEVALERAFALSRRLKQHGWATTEQLQRDSVDYYPVPPTDSLVN